MPHYEFFCLDGKKLFSQILSLVDYEEGEVVCRIAAARTSSSACLPLPSSRRKRARERAGSWASVSARETRLPSRVQRSSRKRRT